MSKEIRQMIDKVKNFKQFINEQVENNMDRTKLNSKLFFVSNVYKKEDGVIKYVEVKPFKHNSIDKIFIYSNSVVFYKNGEPIDEIKNINIYTNEELVNTIESRMDMFN
jgi:hypothetical protein